MRARAATARILRSRQRVGYQNNIPNSVEWVIFWDILIEEKKDSRKANKFWSMECYTPEIYIVDGEQVTRAEAYVARGQAGMERQACDKWWTASGFQPSGDKRAPGIQWKHTRIQQLMILGD